MQFIKQFMSIPVLSLSFMYGNRDKNLITCEREHIKTFREIRRHRLG